MKNNTKWERKWTLFITLTENLDEFATHLVEQTWNNYIELLSPIDIKINGDDNISKACKLLLSFDSNVFSFKIYVVVRNIIT